VNKVSYSWRLQSWMPQRRLPTVKRHGAGAGLDPGGSQLEWDHGRACRGGKRSGGAARCHGEAARNLSIWGGARPGIWDPIWAACKDSGPIVFFWLEVNLRGPSDRTKILTASEGSDDLFPVGPRHIVFTFWI
jgi:hypothetical protein